jgi:type IV secretion system protein VirB9
MNRFKLGRLLILIFMTGIASAESIPRGSLVDQRVKLLVYNPNQVYKLTAYYGYQIDLQLAPSEEVRTIAAGDTVGWQIVASGQHIFIKPMAQNARTNLSIVTSKRTYIFDLLSRPAFDRADITYLVRFRYPDVEPGNALLSAAGQTYAPKFNFDYKLTGSKKVQPARVFDDGEFTYFQFSGERELPAIFVVGANGKEGLVNYRMQGSTMVVERLGDFYTLRNGRETATAINERSLGQDQLSLGKTHD